MAFGRMGIASANFGRLGALGGARAVAQPWSLGRLVNMAANGDSHHDYGTFRNSVTETVQNRSYLGFFERKLGWNYRHPKNYGVVGVQIAATTSYITNAGVGTGGPVYGALGSLSPVPDIVLETTVGHNDIIGGRTLNQLQTDTAALHAAYDLAFSSSTRIVRGPIWPSSQTGSIETLRTGYNAWLPGHLAGLASRYKYVDLNSVIADGVDPTKINSLYNNGTGGADFTHLRPLGGSVFADALIAQLTTLDLQPSPIGVYPYALDVASAATSDPTNILRRLGAAGNADTTRWQFAGSGGTKTNVTGSAPDGWTAAANVAWTTSAGAQPSVAVSADGTNLQAVTFTIPSGTSPSTAANGQITLTSPAIGAARMAELGVTNTDEIRGGVRVECAGLVGIAQLRMTATWSDGTTSFFRTDFNQVSGTTQAATDFIATNVNFDLIVPELDFAKVSALSSVQLTSIVLAITPIPSVTAGGTVKFKKPYYRKLAYLAAGNPS